MPRLPVKPDPAHELVRRQLRAITRGLRGRRPTNGSLRLELEVEGLAMQETVLDEEPDPRRQEISRAGKQLQRGLDIGVVNVLVDVQRGRSSRELADDDRRAAADLGL